MTYGRSCGGLFDGIGLLAFGLHLAGWEHSWLCESDEWRRGILARRWPGIPIYDDVRAVGHGVRPVTLIAGGFPCKGASTLGKLEGFGHPETVLWREMARAVGELRPRYVLVENVANLLGLHDGEVWGEVLGDLASFGYNVVWDCLPAAAVGAPHLRDRVFAVATYAAGESERTPNHEADAIARGGDARQVPRLGNPEPASDPHKPRTDAHAALGGSRSTAGERVGAPTDSGGERQQQVARGAHGDEAADEGRASEHDHEPASAVESVGVDWGEYGPAIRRWEAIAGPAPQPLIRGVDARHTARVVRSQLSALGDGVQVQVGYIAGRYILEREVAA